MNWKDVNWTPLIFMSVYHLLLLVLLPYYLLNWTPSAAILWWTIGLWFVTGLGVTLGYHRLYSHRSYELNKFVESIVLWFATMATEGSAFQWCHDHRLHHTHVDTKKDPYTVKDGFWHAHILWMFKKEEHSFNKNLIPDLWNNKLLQFQHNYYVPLLIATNGSMLLLVGWLTGDYFGAFVFTYLLRLFLMHHCTWFINSAAHYWGSKTFSHEHTAVNNALIALLTYGEGYHNYHHTFASDYRNGVRWWQFDPTKWTIWLFSKLGLAKNLKTISPYIIKRKIVEERTRHAIERLAKRKELHQRIHQAAERVRNQLIHINQLVKEYQSAQKQARKELRQRIKTTKRSIKKDWHAWATLLKAAQHRATA